MRLSTLALAFACLLPSPPARGQAGGDASGAGAAHRAIEREEYDVVVRRIRDLQRLIDLEPEQSRPVLEFHLAEMLLQRAELLGFRLLDTPEDDAEALARLEEGIATDRYVALETLRSCTAGDRLDAEQQTHALYLLAGLLADRGDTGGAIDALAAVERAARTPTERARAAELQGYVLLGSHDLTEPDIRRARAAFARARTAEPARLNPLLGLGETAELLGRSRVAFEHFAAAFERAGDAARDKILRGAAIRGLARTLSRSGSIAQARAALAALAAPPDPIWPHLARGYLNRRAYADALAAYRLAIPLAVAPRAQLALHVDALEAAVGTGRRAEIAQMAVGLAGDVARVRGLGPSAPWASGDLARAEAGLLVAVEGVRVHRARWSRRDEEAVLTSYLAAFGDSATAPRVHYLVATRDPREDKPCEAHRADAGAFAAASEHPAASAELALDAGFQAVRSLSLCRPDALDGDRPRPAETDREIITRATAFLERFGDSPLTGVVARLAGDAASARREDDGARRFYARAVDAEGEGFVYAVLAQVRHLRAIDDLPALEARAAAAASDPRLPMETRRILAGVAETAAYALAARAPELERADRLIDVAERYVDGVLRDRAIFEAGTFFADAGRTADALGAFEQVIEAAPTSGAAARARIAMGRLLESLGRYDEAGAAYTAWLDRSAEIEGISAEHLRWVRDRVVRIHRAQGRWRALWATEAAGLSAAEAHTLRVRLALERLAAGDRAAARRLAADASGEGDAASALEIVRSCQPEHAPAFTDLAAGHGRPGPLAAKALAWCAADTLAALVGRLPAVEPGAPAPTLAQAREVFQLADGLVKAILQLDTGAPAIEAVAAWAEIIGAFAVALSPEPIEDAPVAEEAEGLRADAWATWVTAHAGRARSEQATAARALGAPARRLDGRLSRRLARAFRRIVDAENRAFGELLEDEPRDPPPDDRAGRDPAASPPSEPDARRPPAAPVTRRAA